MKYTRIILVFTVVSIMFFACNPINDHTAEAIGGGGDWKYFGEVLPGKDPQLFLPNIISTPRHERDLAMSPKGDEIFYTLVSPGRDLYTIAYLKHDGAFWSDHMVAPFSGQYSDIEPAFSPDGNKLFFVSQRPLHANDDTDDWNIWFVKKKQGVWSLPQPLDTLINTEGGEYYPSISNNGNLYFTATRDSTFGQEDIYISKFEDGKYQMPQNLGRAVNSNMFEFNAYVDPNEEYLLFSSMGRADDLGGGDLYISRNIGGIWQPAQNLGNAINSNAIDYCPFVSWDKKLLFFTSERYDPAIDNLKKKSLKQILSINDDILNGLGNIYWVEWKE